MGGGSQVTRFHHARLPFERLEVFTRLTIRNFQCHRKAVVAFGPGVTTITGTSDVGKSAVLRALRWVALNRPNGEAIIKSGAGTASVRLEAAGAPAILRERGTRGNTYRVGTGRYVAFGNEVPPPVQAITGTAALNFQGQHDAPFWFGETPGEVSRQLNEIINLGTIDRTLAKLNSAIRENNATAGVVAERLHSAKMAKKRLGPVRLAAEALNAVERRAENATVARSNATGLRALVENALEHTTRAERAAALQWHAQRVLVKGAKWEELANQCGALAGLVQAGEAAARACVVVPTVKPLEQLWGIAVNAERERMALAGLVRAAENGAVVAGRAVAVVVELERKLKKLKGKVCPLCGNSIKN